MDKTFTLELGDIIQITTTSNNSNLYVIIYIDNTILELIDLETNQPITFPIISNKIQHSDITKITLMNRNKLKGFALQHNLLPKKRIVIGFKDTGELTGEILELQNDIITVLLDNTYEVIYINFKFQGLPKLQHLPSISYIIPTDYKKIKPQDKMREMINQILEKMDINPDDFNLDYISNHILENNSTITDEMIPYIHILINEYIKNKQYKSSEPIPKLINIGDIEDESKVPDLPDDMDTPLIEISKEQSSKLLAELNETDKLIETGSSSEELLNGEIQEMYIDDNLVYSIDEQTTDLLDDLLSTIPYENRTITVLDKIHTIINRYIQLRQLYIQNIGTTPDLLDSTLDLNISPYWLIPIVNHKKQVCDPDPDSPPLILELENAFKLYNESVDNRYKTYLNRINTFFSSVYINVQDEGENPCITKTQQLNKELLVATVESTDITLFKYMNEIMCQTGMLILPNNIRKYSRIWKPMMSLLDTLSVDPIYMYKQLPTLQINSIFVDSLIDKTNIINEVADANANLVSGDNKMIQKYIFSNNLDYTQNITTILNRECNLIKYLITYKRDMSIGKLINKLDIYDIYYFNVKYDQFLQIKKVLMRNISKYKKQYTKTHKIFKQLSTDIDRLSVKIANNPLCNLIKNKENLEKAYNIKPCDDYTTSELITNLNKVDYSILYHMYILYNSLTSSEYIIPEKEPSPSSSSSSSEHISEHLSEDIRMRLSVSPITKPKGSECKKIDVVKIYLYIDDLMEDNNHIIHTDSNSREVMAGDYAILFENSMNILYYHRVNNKWTIDTTIPNTYIYDSPYMFCNNNLMCAKDYNTQTCRPIKTIIKHIIESVHNNIEPHNQVFNYTQELLELYFNRTIALIKIQQNEQQKYTRNKYKLGNTREFNEVITSPYLEEFITILGEESFKKRQELILAFCNSYTRIYNNKNNMETVHWRYCIKTDVKLVPSSIYNIANLYNIYSGDIPSFNYNLELLKKDIGVISEDGDYVIDKHSGFKISDILFDVGEEYNEAGFKIITREVIDTTDQEDDPDKQIKQFELLMDTEYSKTIRNIIGYVSDKMNINLQTHIPFIIRQVVNGLLREPSIKKNKTLHDVFLMFLTLGLIIVSIQINIPNIKSNKPFPNCKESFIGFPLTPTETDISAIEYIACIILFAKQPTSPWKILHKYNKTTLTEQLIKFIKTYILTVPEITNKLQDKVMYLSSYKEHPIPFEHNISKWFNFMPNSSITTYIPTTYKIFSIHHINEIVENPVSYTNLHILSILYHLSISIQLKIAEIIIKNANKALLKTRSGQPYVENSCCIEHDNFSTISYFMNEDIDIRKINEISIKLSHIYNLNRKLVKGDMFNSVINTARKFPNIITPYLQKTTIDAICIHNIKKSIDYKNNLNGTLYENTKTLNDSGIFFSEKEAMPILKNTFLKTMTTIPVAIYHLPIELLYTHINGILHQGPNVDTIYKPKFIDHILPILQVKLDNNVSKFKKDISTFRTFLNESIKTCFNNIKTTLNKVNLRSSAKQLLVTPFLDEAHPNYIFNNFTSSDIYIDTCKTLFINMSQVFPNIIINKKFQDVNFVIPSYWKLSSTHVNDLQPILKFKYNILSKFYSYVEMVPLLNTIMMKTESFIDTLINSHYISVNEPNANISKTTFDSTTTQLLFKYYIYLLTSEILTLSTKINNTGEFVPETTITNNLVLLQQSAQYIQTCFEISTNTKTIINKEVQSVMDSIINIKNIEKNILLANLGKLTDDEHMSNKVLKMLKLKRWSVPKNLRSYTKSGYDEDAGIYDEDDAFNYDATEYDVSETMDGDGNENDDSDNIDGTTLDLDADVGEDMDFDYNWDDFDTEMPNDLGDTVIEDGDYYNIMTVS